MAVLCFFFFCSLSFAVAAKSEAKMAETIVLEGATFVQRQAEAERRISKKISRNVSS